VLALLHREVLAGHRSLVLFALSLFLLVLQPATAWAKNYPPRISGTPPTSATVGQPYSFRPQASDPEGAALRFYIARKPVWATFDPATGALSGTPAPSHVGLYRNIRISVSDGVSTVSLQGFTIAVRAGVASIQPPNSTPTISGTPATSATVGVAYAFQPTASDPDGNTLTYSVANLPAWATFSASTGRLSGTPTSSAAGLTFSGITVSVSDGTASASLAPFAITVTQPNRAPTISGTPATVATVGSAYAFQPTGSDADGNTLTYAIANRPTWATFNTSTGQLTGTPSSAYAGTTAANIVISVSDGSVSASLTAFSISVQVGNRAPTLSGTPPTSVTVGQPYSFRPTASDADGNTLTFSIANRPAWATFSSTTGQLSGTPGSSYAGTTASNIVVSVSDGTVSTALPAFSIAVRAATTGSATLSWTPPTTNSDGTPLTNLAGFRVVYGQASRQYSQALDIPSAVVTSAMIENLATGTWYFAVKAYTAAGVESDVSNEASKTIL
jgi:hypothetical protein